MTTRAFRNCRKKVAYDTRDKALARGWFFWQNNKTALKAYKCDQCGKWHLTKQ